MGSGGVEESTIVDPKYAHVHGFILFISIPIS